MIVDANGRPSLSAKHEMQLNALEADTVKWLGEEITAAMRRSRGGTIGLDVAALKDKLDQLYMLGRHHEAGS